MSAAHEWHRAPDPGSAEPCPICGSVIAGRRPHRRALTDRFWIVRGANAPMPVVVRKDDKPHK